MDKDAMESKMMAWISMRVAGQWRWRHSGWRVENNRAQRDSLPQAARRAGTEVPGSCRDSGAPNVGLRKDREEPCKGSVPRMDGYAMAGTGGCNPVGVVAEVTGLPGELVPRNSGLNDPNAVGEKCE